MAEAEQKQAETAENTNKQASEAKTQKIKKPTKNAQKKKAGKEQKPAETTGNGLQNFYVEGYGNCRGKDLADATKRAAKIKADRRK